MIKKIVAIKCVVQDKYRKVNELTLHQNDNDAKQLSYICYRMKGNKNFKIKS